jgi:hypothetical protein
MKAKPKNASVVGRDSHKVSRGSSSHQKEESGLVNNNHIKDAQVKPTPKAGFHFKVSLNQAIKNAPAENFDPLASFERILSESKNQSYFDLNPIDAFSPSRGPKSHKPDKLAETALRSIDSSPIEEKVEEEQEESKPATLRGSLLQMDEKTPRSNAKSSLNNLAVSEVTRAHEGHGRDPE